jgi:hypothetical protein
MTPYTAPRFPRTRSVVCTFVAVLALLVFRSAFGDELRREIPVVRDGAGSVGTVTISRDGARQSAAPSAWLAKPTVDRAVERVEKATGVDLRRDANPRHLSGAAGPPPCRPADPDPGEITARDAARSLKALREALKSRRADGSPPGAHGTAAAAGRD